MRADTQDGHDGKTSFFDSPRYQGASSAMIGRRGKGEKTGLRLNLEMRGCHGNDWYADRRKGREQTSYGGRTGEETCSRNEYEEREKSEARKGGYYRSQMRITRNITVITGE